MNRTMLLLTLAIFLSAGSLATAQPAAPPASEQELAQQMKATEFAELKLQEASLQVLQQFAFIKRLVIHARGSRNPLWGKLITIEYFRLVDLKAREAEIAFEAAGQWYNALVMEQTINRPPRPGDPNFDAKMAEHDARNKDFQVWHKNVGDVLKTPLLKDWNHILLSAARRIPAGQVRDFHVAIYHHGDK